MARLALLAAVGLAVGLVLWGTLHESRAVGPFVTVTGIGCGGRSLASGFAVGDDLVVTAAHPVAGRRQVAVTDDTGRTRHGFVVALDAALDVAALRVPGLGATPVSLAAGDDPALGSAWQYRHRGVGARGRRRRGQIGRDHPPRPSNHR